LDSISQELDGLGDTPAGVARMLRAAGIKGQRGSTSFLNPVVRYLNRTLVIGARLEIEVGGAVLRLVQRGQVQELPLPVAVQEFLDGFHRALYPDLEEP
jgi:hypothetical protein